MAGYLVTPSLLDSFSYFLSDWGSDEDFIRTLKRERSEPNEAMQKGIGFENAVVRYVETGEEPKHKKAEAVKEVASYCTGGEFQVRLKADINVSGLDICLYGRADCITEDRIVDIKTTKAYKLNKYYRHNQKLVYPFLAKAMGYDVTCMQFVVCSGSKVYCEQFPVNVSEDDVCIEIAHFLGFIQDTKYEHLYYENWRSKK